jgi:hypothetical protein
VRVRRKSVQVWARKVFWALSARVLEGKSGVATNAPVVRTARTGGARGAAEFEVPLANLANGTSVVEMTGASEGREQIELPAFRLAE